MLDWEAGQQEQARYFSDPDKAALQLITVILDSHVLMGETEIAILYGKMAQSTKNGKTAKVSCT